MIPPRFTLNKEGRDLVVGDIHGCFSKLQDQLDKLQFDGAVDRLFATGDLVDRGSESPDVLDWLAKPWFHSVQGNHEWMAAYFAAGVLPERMYKPNGGDWLISLVAKNPSLAATIGRELAQLPVVIEVETAEGLVGICHAACDTMTWPEFLQRFDGDYSEPHIENTQWGRGRPANGDEHPVQGVRAVIVGHTAMKQPTWFGNVLHIDSLAWKNNGAHEARFHIIDLATMEAACSAT